MPRRSLTASNQDFSTESSPHLKYCGSCPGQFVSARVRAYAKHRFSIRQAHKKSKTSGAPPPDMNIDSRKLTRFAKALRGRRIGVAGGFYVVRLPGGSGA